MNASAGSRWTIAQATLGARARMPGRTVLAIGAIALGVALGFAVQLINDTAVSEFGSGMAALSGDAQLQVRGSRAGFSERIFPLLARDDDIAIASPVIEIEAKLPGRDDTLTILGVDAFRAAGIAPALVGEASDRYDFLRPDTIFLSPAAATWLAVKPGDTLVVQVGLRFDRLRIAGYAHGQSGTRYGVMDIAAAQDRFARVGRLSRIDLRLRPGVDAPRLRARLAPLLPPGVTVAAPQASVDAFARLTRAYRVNLDVLALVALFTGGLLVLSTQALSVVARRSQFALLRALGLSRRGLASLIVGEGAVLGVLGAAFGIAVGYLLASAALRYFGDDLGAGWFRGEAPRLAFDPIAAIVFAALGMLATIAGSLAPALEAARADPSAALRAGDERTAWAALKPAAPGTVLLIAGACLTFAPPIAGLPLAGYAAIAAILVGAIALMPRLASSLLDRLPRPRSVPAALALDQLRSAPAQIGVSLAAIVAGVALMVSMAIMVASFRVSLDDWLTKILPADVYVRPGLGTDSAYLTVDDQRDLAQLAGVARIEFMRVQSLLLDPERPRVVLLARDLPAPDPGSRLPLVARDDARSVSALPPAWINEAVADFFSLQPGDTLTLPLDDRTVSFRVAGIWRDYARQQGAIVIERARYAALTGDRSANDAALWLAAGATATDIKRELEKPIAANALSIATPGEIRALSLRIFDRTFAVTYALEAVAVGIGLTGLASSFSALVLARRREFGVLRHLGMTRREIAAMLATEGFIVSGIGLCVGLGLGFVISLILIEVVNRQSFHWGMDLHVPGWPLTALTIALLALSTLTALASARRAMSVDAVRAVKDDW